SRAGLNSASIMTITRTLARLRMERSAKVSLIVTGPGVKRESARAAASRKRCPGRPEPGAGPHPAEQMEQNIYTDDV
ncbi:MAG: hypothetical protein ACRD3T_22175, partial [Terriglobia bacterium]